MDASIRKTVFPSHVLYIVEKWDSNLEIIETYRTKKKRLATEKFSQFFRETYKK